MRKQRSPDKSDSSDWELDEEVEPDDEGQSLDETISSGASRGRGRPKIAEKWSRVISLSTDDLSSLRVFELAPDLLLGGAMSKATTRGKSQRKWKPLFWPDDYLKAKHDMTLAGNTLSEAQLKKHAVAVTKVRKLFSDRALAILGGADGFDSAAYLSTTEKLARRMHKGPPSTLKSANICMEPHKTKKELWRSFDLDAKVQMLYDVVVKKWLLKDAAKKYGRTPAYVSA